MQQSGTAETAPVDQTSTDPVFITVRVAAENLGLSSYTVDQLIKDGDLPAVKIRGRLYIPVTAYDEYKARMLSAASPSGQVAGQ